MNSLKDSLLRMMMLQKQKAPGMVNLNPQALAQLIQQMGLGPAYQGPQGYGGTMQGNEWNQAMADPDF